MQERWRLWVLGEEIRELGGQKVVLWFACLICVIGLQAFGGGKTVLERPIETFVVSD